MPVVNFNFKKFHRKPRARDTKVTIYSTSTISPDIHIHENSHNVAHTSATDSYNNSSTNYRERIAVTQPPNLSFPQGLAHDNQPASHLPSTEWADEISREPGSSSIPSGTQDAPASRPLCQTHSNGVPVNVPTLSEFSAGDHVPRFKSNNPFGNLRHQPPQVPYLTAMAPSSPPGFESVSEPQSQSQPRAQHASEEFERFCQSVTQDSLRSEERNGSTRRCPTCGSLSTRNFFPTPLHSPQPPLGQTYGLPSQYPPESYAGSYFSRSPHGAPARTPCSLCGYFHTSPEPSLHASRTDHQAAAQMMNPFTTLQPYGCPLVANSFPQSPSCLSRTASRLDISPAIGTKEFYSIHSPNCGRCHLCPNHRPG